MMKKIYPFLFLIVFVLLVCYSFCGTYRGLDPDFGWHLHTGQLILEKGIPYQDWYSYTMPNFPWIDHEWLTDVFIYEIYSHLGFYSLLAIFLIIYTLSFFIVRRPGQKDLEFFLPVILGYLATVRLLGIRPQLITVFFVAIILYLINKFFKKSSKLFYIIPFLFILWVNLHAGFSAGLFILGLVFALEIFKKIKFSWESKISHFFDRFKLEEHSWGKIISIGVVLFFSFLATIINPYGIKIYEEVFRTIGDNFVRIHIAEWMPLFFSGVDFSIYVYIGIFIGFLLVYYKEVEFNDIILSLFLLFLALSSVRNVLLFVIVTVPIICEMLSYLKNQLNLDVKKIYSLLDFWLKCVIAYWIIAILILMGVIFYYNYIVGTPDINYPEKAIPFLKTLPLSENLFNDYGWGGYLIWKIPERKYFIDGRMPCWRQNGQFVFGDYIKISEAENGFDKILQKYNVDLVITSKKLKDEAEKKKVIKNSELLSFFEKHKTISFILGISLPKKNLYQELIKLGWKVIYQDEVTVVLKK